MNCKNCGKPIVRSIHFSGGLAHVEESGDFYLFCHLPIPSFLHQSKADPEEANEG